MPGLGLPLRSAGSYGISAGGGRDDSDEVRERCEDRVGEFRAGIYGKYDGASVAVGASLGAVSSIEGECGREIEEVVDGEGW